MNLAAAMDSPANPIDCGDKVTDTIKRRRILIKYSNVEARSVTGSIRVPESVSDDLGKPQADGGCLKPEMLTEKEDSETAAAAANSNAVRSSFYRRGGGSKRKKGNDKKRKQHEEKSKEKLKVLVGTLKAVAFKPYKTVDFSRYDSLLKTLGLWDFVHLEFDECIHYDLVAQLIAYYSPEGRCSYVNGSRIKLSRADLARALKLPNKKERVVILDEDKELLESDESIGFVEDIVSNWILLHCDDAWMMPDEVVEWRKGLKGKQLDKLDWAGLLWFMVEKELKAEPPLGDCFYASHMQMVIRSQKQDLFWEHAKVEEDLLVKSLEEDMLKEEPRVDLEDVNATVVDLEVNDDGASDLKVETCVEEHMIELNLGQETVSKIVAKEEHHHEEQPIDLMKNKEERDERLLWNEDSGGGSSFLQGCDVGVAIVGDEGKRIGYREVGKNDTLEDVAEDKIEEDTEKREGGFPLLPKSETLHCVAHENPMLGDTSSLGYNSGLQIHANSTGDLMASWSAVHMVPGSSLFGNSYLPKFDHENDTSYHVDNPVTKRLKTNEPPWDDKPVPFEVCMEQIKLLADKAKLSYVEKERACGKSNLRQQMLLSELQRREEIIQQLNKDIYEEQQRKDMEIYKLENELGTMTNVLAWYRKALKETQKERRKHMKCCPLRGEPLYKDVKGSGGLVLSTVEHEKLRLKQEEEERKRQALIKKQVEECANLWIKQDEVKLNQKLELLEEKLIGFQNMVKLLKRTVPRREVLDTPERFAAEANS